MPDLIIRGYQFMDRLGEGQFGIVFKCLNLGSGKIFAAKVIDKDQITREPFLREYIDNEIKAIKSIDSAHVIRLQDYFENDEAIFIIMEYCDGGDLLRFVTDRQKNTQRGLPEDEVVRLTAQILDGLRAMHEHSIIHRDLKPDNIFLTNRNQPSSSNSQLDAIIGDFGMCRTLAMDQMTKTICGTDVYMAPEIHKGSDYNLLVDMWSLGCIIFFMLFGQPPFETSANYLKRQSEVCLPHFSVARALKGKSAAQAKNISSDMESLLGRILTIDVKQRLTFEQLYQDQIFERYRTKNIKALKHFFDNKQKSLLFYSNIGTLDKSTDLAQLILQELTGKKNAQAIPQAQDQQLHPVEALPTNSKLLKRNSRLEKKKIEINNSDSIVEGESFKDTKSKPPQNLLALGAEKPITDAQLRKQFNAESEDEDIDFEQLKIGINAMTTKVMSITYQDTLKSIDSNKMKRVTEQDDAVVKTGAAQEQTQQQMMFKIDEEVSNIYSPIRNPMLSLEPNYEAGQQQHQDEIFFSENDTQQIINDLLKKRPQQVLQSLEPQEGAEGAEGAEAVVPDNRWRAKSSGQNTQSSAVKKSSAKNKIFVQVDQTSSFTSHQSQIEDIKNSFERINSLLRSKSVQNASQIDTFQNFSSTVGSKVSSMLNQVPTPFQQEQAHTNFLRYLEFEAQHYIFVEEQRLHFEHTWAAQNSHQTILVNFFLVKCAWILAVQTLKLMERPTNQIFLTNYEQFSQCAEFRQLHYIFKQDTIRLQQEVEKTVEAALTACKCLQQQKAVMSEAMSIQSKHAYAANLDTSVTAAINSRAVLGFSQDFKEPYRKVLSNIYAHCIEVSKKIYPTSKEHGLEMYRLALRLLLCHMIGSVFRPQHVKKLLEPFFQDKHTQQFTFEEFKPWLNTSKKQTIHTQLNCLLQAFI